MRELFIAQLLFLLLVFGPIQSLADDSSFPEGTVQHVVLARDIAWRPCPANLPAGCEIAILEGNPQEPGLFTVRFRLSDSFAMPPHTHPKDERVTVLKGLVSVAFGLDASREDARQFGPGDYYVNMRGAIHSVWGDGAVEIQITGLGPWEAHFINRDEPEAGDREIINAN